MKHSILYQHPDHYASFPHVATDKGALLVVFRQAGIQTARAALTFQHTHQDTDARILFIRSEDSGETWSAPSVVRVGDFTGVTPSDPAITPLSDGRYVVRYAQWRLLPRMSASELHEGIHRHFVRTGEVGQVYGCGLSVSEDKGQTWEVWHERIQLGYASREPLIELGDGTLLYSDYSGYPHSVERAYIRRSWDGGKTWDDSRLIAGAPSGSLYRQAVNYNETALVLLDETTLLALIRMDVSFTTEDEKAQFMSEGGVGELQWAVSYDVGFTWSAPRPTGIYGQPAQLLRLHDGTLLATYGYRQAPYGVRVMQARFDPRSGWQNLATGVLRADGHSWDVGYPASAQLPDGSLYTVYYLHHADGVRYIGGTRWHLDELTPL